MKTILFAVVFLVALCNSFAIAQDTKILNLSWADNSNNETGFEIERKVDAGPYALQLSPLANQTGITDTVLVDPSLTKTYCYRMRAFISQPGPSTGNLYSGYSNEACATIIPPAPGAPTVLNITCPQPCTVTINGKAVP